MNNVKVKKAISTTVFLLIILFVFSFLNELLIPDYVFNNGNIIAEPTVKHMYSLRRDTVDVVAVGQSTALCSFSPMAAYDETGISSYNLASSAQPLYGAYIALSEFLKQQNPKVVLVEAYGLIIDTQNWLNVGNDYAIVADALPLSMEKITTSYEISQNPGHRSLVSYLFPISQYHDRWKDISVMDIANVKQSDNPFSSYRYVMYNGVSPLEFQPWTETGTETTETFDLGEKYFNKIVEMCNAKNISVIVYRAPSSVWTKEEHNTVKELTDKLNIPFYDFNMADISNECDFNYSTDMNDIVHGNINGAVKVTKWLANKISSEYFLPDRRGEIKYEYLDRDYNIYKREIDNIKFIYGGTMSEYLDLMNMQGYTVFFSISGDGASQLDDNLKRQMVDLGFTTDFTGKVSSDFIGVLDTGNGVIYENTSNSSNKSEYQGVLQNGTKYHIYSAGDSAGALSSIVIDGKEYSRNIRGINIVVYDNLNERIVDCVGFLTSVSPGLNWDREPRAYLRDYKFQSILD